MVYIILCINKITLKIVVLKEVQITPNLFKKSFLIVGLAIFCVNIN